MKFKPTIGLEIHIELHTKTKMFCDSPNDPDEKHPNVNVCPVCMGHPGTLPVPNKTAIEYVILAGKALNCEISKYSQFDRKNYFYPDLPKGYQISQFYYPLCKNGLMEINGNKIRIKEIHLEEDVGRLNHPKEVDYSLVNFNRAGTPLMELVTEPDISSGSDAKKFCEELQLITRYLGISDADMERGQMRCEVNISMSKDKKLGTKIEIKNLNSFKVVEKSIDYEIKRQEEVLESGEVIAHETRGWNEKKQETFSQRTKETAKDYRYFPEPDIPPLKFTDSDSDFIYLPELPEQRRKRFKKEYGLPSDDIEVLVVNKSLGEYFEKVISELKEWDKSAHKIKLSKVPEHIKRITKLSANYLITELQKIMRNATVVDINNITITPENFAELVILTHNGEISSSATQEVLLEMFNTGADPSHIIEEKGLRQESDSGELEKIAEVVIKNNPQAVEDYKNGKAISVQFLVGQMMRETKGKANPQIAKESLINLLK